MSTLPDPAAPSAPQSRASTSKVTSVYRAIESVESKVWWGPIVRGLIALAIAVIIMVTNTGQDNTAIKAAVLLTGIFAAANGVIGLACWFMDRGAGKGPIFFALVSIVVGAVLIAWPQTAAKVAVVIFGVFVVAMGAAMTYSGVKLRGATQAMNGLLVTGPILLILGIVIAFTPLFWAKLIIWLLAILLAVFGIVLIIIGWSIRRALRATTVVEVHPPRA